MSMMMTAEQKMAVEGLRKFLDNEIEPKIRAHGEHFIPKNMMKSLVSALAEYGLIKAPHPEEWGGLNMDWVTHLRLWEEVAVSSLDLAMPILINVCAADLLINHAPGHIQEKYLPGLLSGEMFAGIGISEPDVGSDVAAAKTRAVRDGDHWIINGEKTWISSGEYMDLFICTCKTGKGELTHIAIDANTPGLEARGISKIALNGQSTSQVFLSDVRVPMENTIGGVGQGLKNTLVTFERARCHMAAWGYSIARRALEESINYSQIRSQHGKQIAGHQLIAEKIADMATHIDAARLLTLRAAELIDNGQRCDKECSMAKWYSTEMAVKACRDAVQIHGGNGVTKEFIVERLAREAILGPIPDGTTEIQKLLIARLLTGIQAFR
ncbi:MULTISPECIES: acyl-CoA dehydrogenase family protein [Pseudomonadaceae]|uniref:Acyl-CoA/acyl-ACP dehydrogenase n=1 Tax=Stutzerimonas chloritidismutans TaxID=203192 RepID=A0ACC5VPI5_STUCH|nr:MULTISPECIES: acyl-CoA dehydrogenase family protein [Pseudomonadaceae]MBT1079829.1 acyl-CoA/acyl-ACP dehydrogenase [Pseudomonas aeruginosa]MBX7274275.1 acyl-CoA/acyl-ACP dehydrogenase [Stutzerimonas chloritidismutans]MCS7968331.1 acyl-CoA/acyl-ACP dehydrogenase [Pseudomonas aeruginosa]MCS8136983.1 acyl-CoA/acyl-ACP dehydrogenase [Pseudomonas aeruginosa]MCS8179012.1 acyl-CoA/acyl-ACP dehydrogenase [Pseudomonas aeruginosa]